LFALVAGAGACGEKKREGNLQEPGAGCPATFDGTPAGLPACPEAWR
jgi:hypothetical protein